MSGFERFVFTFFNADIALRYWPDILKGMGITASVGIAVSVTGVAFGLALAVLRAVRRPWLSVPIVIFADVMRSLPPLGVIILFFFAFPLVDLPVGTEGARLGKEG